MEFDLIGQSYYPFWHGDLEALRNCLHLTWPLSGAGFACATSSNLVSPTTWFTSTNEIQASGLDFETTLPLGDEPSRFFRLQLE